MSRRILHDAWARVPAIVRAILLDYAARAALGWVVALPLISATGSSNVGALPEGDRALFEPGGLWLAELVVREGHALFAALRVALVLSALALAARTVPLVVLFRAAAGKPPQAGLVSRFLGIGVVEIALRVLLLILVAIAARMASTVVPGHNEALADLGPAVVLAVGLGAWGALSVVLDAWRAASVVEPQLALGPSAALASTVWRRSALPLLGRYALLAGAGALTVALAARATTTLDVSKAGAGRFSAVLLVHQATLLALAVLEAAFAVAVTAAVSRSATPRAHGDRAAHSVALDGPSRDPAA